MSRQSSLSAHVVCVPTFTSGRYKKEPILAK
jgi:hypothetical protein